MTYKEILKEITEHGMTIAVAQEIANDPELYRKLAGTANSRIRTLREKGYLNDSFAYSLLKDTLDGNKTVPLKRKGRKDKLSDIIDIGAFLSAKTSTVKGYKKVRANKIAALRANIEDRATFKDDNEREAFFNFFDNLTDDQMNKLTKAYDSILSADFDSGQKFDVFTADILGKMASVKRMNIQTFIKSIVKSNPNKRVRKWQMAGGNLRDATTEEIITGIG